jgi:hypothetical protein
LVPAWAFGCRFVAAALLHTVVVSARAQVPVPLASPPILLTNAQQIAALGTNIAAGAYTARLQAVVIYVSPQTRRLYVQDGDLGVQVNHVGSVAPFRVGNRVEIGGLVLGGEPTLRLSGATASVIGDSPLPEPKLVSVHGLVKGEDAYRYVRVRGMVRDMFSNKIIDDGTGVMRVDTTHNFLRPPADAQRLQREPQTRLQPGERVEVLGARFDFFSLAPSLMTTEYRRKGRGEPVKPIEVSLKELLEGRHAGKLVTGKARLVDQRA